jgi:LysM repeat protein
MKKRFILLFMMTFLTFLTYSPVSASTTSAGHLSEGCGITYKVQSGDSLAKIAMRCDLTISKLISLNPQIHDPNLIYAGQILRLDASADWSITQLNPLFYTYSYFDWSMLYTPSIVYNYASVSLSTTSVKPGGTLTVYVAGYPPNMDIDYRIGKSGAVVSAIYDGVTDANGKASAVLTIPASAVKGEAWVIFVTTTGIAGGPNLYSATIRISD